jgi:uncharacterized protein YrrD
MRKGKHVIGQSVLSYADGSRVDSVKDLLISAANDSVVALLVDEGGLLSSSRVVPIENVYRFGKDAVVIHSADGVVRASADPEVNAIVHRKDTLLGKKVLTNEGQAYGTISDMYFDDETGRISGFEVSGGLLGDIARGTSFLPVADIERMGSDVIFIRPDTGQALEGQVGGIQGGVQGAISSAQEGLSKAQQDAQSAITQKEPEKGLIGRRSGTDVTDQNGRVIVAHGERIRAEHVEWAKQTNNVGALTSAATAGTMAEARDRAGVGLQNAGDSVGSMWDRFVGRLGEMRDEQGKAIDASQTANRLALVQDAIGRPVMKVILDRSDNVILDFGDIVTHQAIQQAFDNGMLDTLLASVHRATVSFPNEDLKARQEASARIDKASGGALVLDELQRKVEQTLRERTEQQERARQEAERARQQRDVEREQRAKEREEAERQRLDELEAAKASGSAASSSGSGETSSARQPQRVPIKVQTESESPPRPSR